MPMPCTVAEIYNLIDALAPFDTAMDWDNVGLLIGRMDRPVDTILTAVDATPGVVAEARALGAQLLITHHPLMFAPLRRLDEAQPEAAVLCDMIRAGLSMIAAHTNLDIAPGGVNDALAAQAGWPVARVEGLLRLGSFAEPQALGALQQALATALDTQAVRFGPADLAVSTFAICAGAGGSEVAAAAAQGAQVLLTGEIRHHEALEAAQRGLAVLACGHRATEICAARLLQEHLQRRLYGLQYKVRVFLSQTDPFG